MGLLSSNLLLLLGCVVIHGYSQPYSEEVIQSLESGLSESLISLGKTAYNPQPQLGIEKGFDPLAAIAPLRYTNEGELLKLRLLLNNVTLEGLSSLTVQEVSFSLPNKHNDHEGSYKSFDVPTTTTEIPETKLEAEYSEREDEETLFEDKDSLHKEYEDNNPLEDMYDYYYYDPTINLNEKYENSNPDKLDYEYEEEDIYDESTQPETDDEVYNERTRRHNRYKRSEEQTKKDHMRHIKGRHSRKSKTKRHNDDKHDKNNKPRDDLEPTHERYEDPIFNYEKLFSHSQHHTRHSHQEHQHKEGEDGDSRRQPASMAQSESYPPPKSMALKANVRIAFSNLKIKAQYIVKGSAGGVFTFKEQGNLILTLPNVFLTSTFNVSVTPEFSGLRHWKSGRNHVRVQKIRSRMSIDSPQLKLIPASRPPEWVRRQVQQKMEELGNGVGRRDGAVRLLLRHWAKILRKLVTKAARDSSNDY